MRLTVALVLAVLLVNAVLGRPLIDSFLFALALAVGLTPELLPMVLSVTLARGAMRLARRHVIVKRLSAVQELGGIDVLCTDKTGALTEGRIRLERHLDALGRDSDRVLHLAYLNSRFESGIRSPLDDAILAHTHIDVTPWRKIDEVPFDFERRRVSVLLERDGSRVLIVKGSLEDVLRLCAFHETEGRPCRLDENIRNRIATTLRIPRPRRLPRARHRLARRPAASGPRPGCRDDGTGVLRVRRFSRPAESQRGRGAGGPRCRRRHGEDRHRRPRTGGPPCLRPTRRAGDWRARRRRHPGAGRCHAASPRRGRRSVLPRHAAAEDPHPRRAEARGHVVGFLGDGINDAPALHAANVGISVDSAVDVAKEAADLVLLEHDLKVLHEGVREGRRTFANVTKYVMMGTSSNFGNMFSMAGGTLFLPFLPMLPIQILLNNLLYDLWKPPYRSMASTRRRSPARGSGTWTSSAPSCGPWARSVRHSTS
ncbi:MAG: HAD-IC family P-type ATPase [Rhodocyclaceae bacterium]|nr:HAD-IC family P-type ATPase [Rhodocyclaceae bacterium]